MAKAKITIADAAIQLALKLNEDENVAGVGYDDGRKQELFLYLVKDPTEVDTKYPKTFKGFKVVIDVVGEVTPEEDGLENSL